MLPPHPQPLPSVQSRSHETTPVAGRSEHKQNKTKLPPTAVRDKMRSIETDRKALESQDQPQNHIADTRKNSAVKIQTEVNRTGSIAGSSVSISSSAREIMAQVRIVEDENSHLELDQINPITKQPATKTQTYGQRHLIISNPESVHSQGSEVLSLLGKVKTKPVPQFQPNQKANITFKNQTHVPAEQTKAPSSSSSTISRHSTISISSSHAKLRLEAAIARNQRLKSENQQPCLQNRLISPCPIAQTCQTDQ